MTASRETTDALTVYYYGDGGALFAFDRAGSRYYVGTDQVGSPRVVTDAAGTVVKTLDYDSYGQVVADSAPSFSLAIGYAGGVADGVTGLVHFGFRDYDTASGAWTARDPSLFGGGSLNLYAYVGGDPVSHADPDGAVGDNDRCNAVRRRWRRRKHHDRVGRLQGVCGGWRGRRRRARSQHLG